MAIVSSFGTLEHYSSKTPPIARSAAPPAIDTSGSGYQFYRHQEAYGELYRTQPAVRTCVDFLGRNLAQMALKVYRRVSDTDRVSLPDHELTTWLTHPNPGTTRYRLFESLMCDMGVYFNAYWWKVKRASGAMIGLVRLQPEFVAVDGWLLPRGFLWTMPDGQWVEIPPDDVVYFGGYDPTAPEGLSLLETLRSSIGENDAACAYREAFWRNAARLEGVIERPLAAPRWTPEQKRAFREQWQDRFAGQPGQTAILDEGMQFKPTSYSARESEYTAAKKFTREEVAALYQIPQPMVGILDHATFSNVREQHKQLYQDTLPPWTVMIEDEVERQLLPEAKDTDHVYVEFNIAEKMKGSFEEQADSIQRLVGRPIMTANEGRARLNLPRDPHPSSDELAQPLNMTTPGDGGATSSQDAATGMVPTTQPAGEPSRPGAAGAVEVDAAIRAAWARQARTLAKVPADDRAAVFDEGRWDRELTADLLPHFRAARVPNALQRATQLAEQVNTDTLQRLVAGRDPFPASREVSYGRS
jgi:HK97 family phage portal protein